MNLKLNLNHYESELKRVNLQKDQNILSLLNECKLMNSEIDRLNKIIDD